VVEEPRRNLVAYFEVAILSAGVVSRRAHFYPAHNVNGNAVPDTVTTPPIVWRLMG